MPQTRSWDGNNGWVYSYTQSEAGNHAFRTKTVNDILYLDQRFHVGANLTNPQVEALFT